MTKYLKHSASEKLFTRINSHILRNTSTLLIYQDLVKVIIVHPKIHPIHVNILLSTGNYFDHRSSCFDLKGITSVEGKAKLETIY